MSDLGKSAGGEARVCILGDVFPGGDLAGRTAPFLSPDLGAWLRGFDLRVANLEGVLAGDAGGATKRAVLYSPLKSIDVLKSVHVDVVSLANNHFHDLGDRGMEATLGALEEAGIGTVGGGRDLDHARRPAIHALGTCRIGILAYALRGYMKDLCFASAGRPGVAPFREGLWQEDLAALRDRVDHVLVLLHWGKEHSWFAPADNVAAARRLVGAGASVVAGSHPHRFQGWFRTGGGIVAMSLGNTLFPNFMLGPPLWIVYPSEDRRPTCPVTRRYELVGDPTYKKWVWQSRISLALELFCIPRSVQASVNVLKQADAEPCLDRVAGPGRWLARMWAAGLGMLYRLPGYGVLERGVRFLERVTSSGALLLRRLAKEGVRATFRTYRDKLLSRE